MYILRSLLFKGDVSDMGLDVIRPIHLPQRWGECDDTSQGEMQRDQQTHLYAPTSAQLTLRFTPLFPSLLAVIQG